MKIRAFLAAILMLAAASVLAATSPNIVVEGVQMPAWVEHASGARAPLAIGMVLNNKDRIYTGPGSRALLRLADGSLIKLGENALLALDDLGQRKTNLANVVTASLDVINGAFRFTTQALSTFRGQRDIKVKIVTITAGIRGTDLWGKADTTRDIVCLIEGRITVARGSDAFTMDQPMLFYIAPRNEPPLPVAPVSQEQLDIWARETDIASFGTGAIRTGGKWRVSLVEANNQSDALRVYDQLRSAGYAAEIRSEKTKAGPIFRVRISNLPNQREAAVLAVKLRGQMGITEPKVSM
jgi:hypothetical protein